MIGTAARNWLSALAADTTARIAGIVENFSATAENRIAKIVRTVRKTAHVETTDRVTERAAATKHPTSPPAVKSAIAPLQ